MKTTSEKRLAVTYARVSSIKQVKRGDGLQSQETRCADYARYNDLEIVASFRDEMSGSAGKRPGMDQLLSFLRKHRKENLVVIIDDMSRLARGRETHWDLREKIESAGGELASPNAKFGKDADSELIESIIVEMNGHQRKKNAEQTKNRMIARAQNGYWVFQAPVGYRYEAGHGPGKKLVITEPAASIVREALEGFASGRFENQAEVQRYLQDNPLFPKDASGLVRHFRVAQMLRQCIYAGYVEVPMTCPR